MQNATEEITQIVPMSKTTRTFCIENPSQIPYFYHVLEFQATSFTV